MTGINLKDVYYYYLSHPKCNYRNMNFHQFVFYYTKYINEN